MLPVRIIAPRIRSSRPSSRLRAPGPKPKSLPASNSRNLPGTLNLSDFMKFDQFSALFGLGSLNPQVPIGAAPPVPVVPIGADSCRNDLTVQAPNGTQRHPTAPIGTENVFSERTWFLPIQLEWIHDPYPLCIWEKSRQVGATKTDAFDSVMKASPAGAKFDVWVTSRDEFQAMLYLEDCKEWARILHIAATDIGLVILDPKNKFSAH